MNGSAHILVVEDDPAIGRLLLMHLREAGWQAMLANTGMAALRLWASDCFQIILLDVMLPDLSGWELCQQFRAESNVPILMLTAKASDDDVVRGLNLGADDYLTKPFSQAQLIARVQRLIKRQALLEPAQPISSVLIEQPEAAPIRSLSGAALLREARQKAGLSLYAAERRTGIRWDYLQAIEQGSFMQIPLKQIKPLLLQYCELLQVDARPIFAHAQQVYLASPEYHPRRNWQWLVAVSCIIVIVIVMLW